MFKFLIASLALAIAAQAYLVESPNGGDGWVSSGQNTVTWSRVSTDADSFDLILSNTDASVFPQFQEVLVSNVDGLTGSFTFEADGLPAGSNFRVNLNRAGQGTQGGIYAQSNPFTISDTGSNTDTTDEPTPTDENATSTTTITLDPTSTETVSGGTVTETEFTPTITETDITTETDDALITLTITLTETDTTTFTDFEPTPVRKVRRTDSPKWVKN